MAELPPGPWSLVGSPGCFDSIRDANGVRVLSTTCVHAIFVSPEVANLFLSLPALIAERDALRDAVERVLKSDVLEPVSVGEGYWLCCPDCVSESRDGETIVHEEYCLINVLERVLGKTRNTDTEGADAQETQTDPAGD